MGDDMAIAGRRDSTKTAGNTQLLLFVRDDGGILKHVQQLANQTRLSAICTSCREDLAI